jgi:hypothetical protein
VKIRF